MKDIGPFSALRVINSTGAVLTAPLWEWAQTAFGRDKCIVASSGGTDICSAFISAAPTLPNYAGGRSDNFAVTPDRLTAWVVHPF